MRQNPALCVVTAIALLAAVPNARPSQAQVKTSITSSGLNTTVTPPSAGGTVYQITGGTRPEINGRNLFHSFGLFSVGEGDTAKFQNITPGIATSNIISRVTEGEVSNIYGTIDTLSYPGANLYLINPAGVIFGPNAKLDVGGSVHASTADYVRFADEKVFSVKAPTPVLTVAAPAAFGFLGTAPSQLVVDGSKLTVQSGQTLSLFGGEVAIKNAAALAAPGGRVQIASLSSGEIGVDGNVIAGSRLGSVTIANSLVGTTGLDENGRGLGSGTVIIRGGQLQVDASTIVAHTWSDVPGARLIDIQVTGDLTLTNGARVSSTTFMPENGGPVTITAGQLRVDNQSLVETNSWAEGNGGSVTATVGLLEVLGGSSIVSTSNAAGLGGNIAVHADGMRISGGGQVSSFALADGSGGKVSIGPRSSKLDLVLDQGGLIGTTTFGTGKNDSTGGDIDINANSVRLLGGGQFNSSTAGLAPGGRITITANAVNISGGDAASPDGSGIFSLSSGVADTGRPGKISVAALDFTLTEGGVIKSGDLFNPVAGDIEISAQKSLTISRGASISSQAFAQPGGQVSLGSSTATADLDGGFVNTSTFGDGPAGNVLINVAKLTMSNGAQVSSSSAELSPAPGGTVMVKAMQSIEISGTGTSINPATNDASSGLFSTTASPSLTGAAGKVIVTAPTLTITDGGKISVASNGAAPAGDISLTVDKLILSGGGGLFSNATSSGAGGSINVQTGQVQLINGATISAKSTGSALAGNITIAATTFQGQDSSVTTEAAKADGGNIDIAVGSMLYLRGSRITTSVGGGEGKGGNITIDPQYVILNGSQVLANAFEGTGGNINIVTDVFLSGDSVVNASSAKNAPGEINISARITNLSDSLVQLPDNVLQAAQLLRAACSTRVSEGKASSLVVSGREGVPPEPEGLLWSPLSSALTDLSVTPSEGYTERFLQFVGLWLGPNCAR